MFTKEGKEKMKELRRKMEARTPAEVATDLAKIRKEKAEREAMASLAGAEEREVVKSREKKRFKDITYLHVDDVPSVLRQTERGLDDVGINKNKNKLGDCGSLREFARYLEALVKAKNPLYFIEL